MEYKKAITVLMNMLKKRSLDKEEKEAIIAAIGVLDWASLANNRMKSIIKAQKDKRAKSIEW
jgi:hypothetical protein